MDLHLALRLNAALSFATGYALALAAGTVGGWLGVSIDGWLRLLGIVLIAHGAILIWVARQRSVVSWAKLNVAAIAPYPLIMVAVIVTGLVSVATGRILLLADGALVGLLAGAQWSGLRPHRQTAERVTA